MKTLICLFALLSFNTAMALTVTCEGPNLHYIYQFDTQINIDIAPEELENLDQNGIVFENQKLTAFVTPAGFNSEETTLEVSDLTLTIKKHDDVDLYGKPFLQLEYLSSKEAGPRVYVNLLVGYPGILNSKMRVGDLAEYKSTCK